MRLAHSGLAKMTFAAVGIFMRRKLVLKVFYHTNIYACVAIAFTRYT